MARTDWLDWVIGMENKTVWVAYADGELVGITASDREAARRLVQTNYLNLNDEEMVSYEVEESRRFCYTSVRKAAEKCRLDVETFLVKALRGQLRGYWIEDCSIEEYVISRCPRPLE